MTIDILKYGFKIKEVLVNMTHNETGRNLKGFIHRGKQYYHIKKVLGQKRKNGGNILVKDYILYTILLLTGLFGTYAVIPLFKNLLINGMYLDQTIKRYDTSKYGNRIFAYDCNQWNNTCFLYYRI